MLNNRLRHATLAATLLLLAACGQDELPTTDVPQPENTTVTFTVDAGAAVTRSVPENPQTTAGKDAVQHVTAVRLYVFRHGDDGKTYFAGCEDIDNTEWTGLPVSTGEEGKTVTKTYTMTTPMLSFTEYTLLGVGYESVQATGDDADYSNAYQEWNKFEGTDKKLLSELSQDQIATSQADPSTGSLTPGDVVDLSAIVTTLATGKDKDRIAHNEYFTGTFRAMTNGSGRLTDAKVEMRRRVAGLSASFKLLNFAEKPAGVAIMLYQAQNKSVPTLPKNWQAPFFEDYTPDALTGNDNPSNLEEVKANPQCILFVPTSTDNNGNAGDGTTTAADGESSTAGGQGEVTTEEGAAYLLPIPAPAYNAKKNYTLAAVVYNQAGQVICTKRAALNVKAEDGSTHLIFATDLGTGIVDDESYYRYPIVANRFYRFDGLELTFDPSNPFEIGVEKGWEGNPDLDFQ